MFQEPPERTPTHPKATFVVLILGRQPFSRTAKCGLGVGMEGTWWDPSGASTKTETSIGFDAPNYEHSEIGPDGIDG